MANSAIIRMEPDPWLASVMNREVFRISLPVGSKPGPELAGQMRATHKGSFFYGKVPTADVQSIRDLIALGFYVVDVAAVFERRSVSKTGEARTTKFTLREAGPNDEEAITRIAGRCFRYSRFHSDPEIAPALAHQIKRDWAANFFRGKRGEKMWVAEMQGQVTGFLSILISKKDSAWTIDLIGVDPDHQGHGIGKALVEQFVALPGDPPTRMRAGTQIANTPSVRLYERCGFSLQESAYVLHAHSGTRA